MRTLAIECATEACSLALFDGRDLLDNRHEVLGRGHAERLIPLIASLPNRGRADQILVSLGPGSFTGVRIGLAAARALGLAWHANVRGYPTLALIAAMARRENPGPVSVCMTGGHGQWFVQNFGADGLPQDEVLSLPPEVASKSLYHPTLAGNHALENAASKAENQVVLDLLPDARAVQFIPAETLISALTPIYGRGPDARLPA